MTDVIILNGGSSSGKTTIVKCLQNSLLPISYLRFSIDDLVEAMPDEMLKAESGITFDDDGSVSPGAEFRRLESAWMYGIAEMARKGARVIVDDVFIGGLESRNRWQKALEGLNVLWVGVFCDPHAAADRERKRGDRVQGMAISQANVVHVGMNYDVRVDTTDTSPEECALVVAERISS